MNIDILEPCNHKVHILCVEKHMKQTLDQPICPLCRVIVTNVDYQEEETEYENDEDQEEEEEEEDVHGEGSNLFYILDNLPHIFSINGDLHSIHFHLNNSCYNDVSQLTWNGYTFIECLLAICMTFNNIPECLFLDDVLSEEIITYADNMEEYCKYAKILIDYSKNINVENEFPAKIGKPFFKFCLWMSDIAAYAE